MEDIFDADYAHSKSVKIFGINILDEYHHLYVQSDKLLLADVLESYRNMSLKYVN